MPTWENYDGDENAPWNKRRRMRDSVDGSLDPERRRAGFVPAEKKGIMQGGCVVGEPFSEDLIKDGRKELPTIPLPILRQFGTGATRDSDEGKNDYEGFIDPAVLVEYGNYMTVHRRQADGSLRDSDNWQKGIPKPQYMKSLLRHAIAAWQLHRGQTPEPEKVGGVMVPVTMKSALCGILFNTMGYLSELLKEERAVQNAA